VENAVSRETRVIAEMLDQEAMRESEEKRETVVMLVLRVRKERQEFSLPSIR
jgi:hypothetical protein